MSCAGKGYGTNPQSNNYLIAQFYSYTSGITGPLYKNSTRSCRKTINSSYPSFNPSLYNLSETTSVTGVYSIVYVNGSNFLPNGSTFIQFGNLGYLPVTYYSSFNLSFSVPLNATPGSYPVRAINLYNGNFSPPVNQSYPGIPNYSNPITYTITTS